MSTLSKTPEGRRPIIFGSVIAFSLTVAAIIFVPLFAWRAQQANNLIAPLESDLASARAKLEEDREQIVVAQAVLEQEKQLGFV